MSLPPLWLICLVRAMLKYSLSADTDRGRTHSPAKLKPHFFRRSVSCVLLP